MITEERLKYLLSLFEPTNDCIHCELKCDFRIEKVDEDDECPCEWTQKLKDALNDTKRTITY